MAIRKWSKLQLSDDARIAGAGAQHVRQAKLADFQFNPEPGFLYVTTRAISSRVNANYDGWPPEELRRAYMTFVGRPVYVDHNNWDLKRSRGVIVDAKLYENKLASGHEDVWVELLIEVDASAFPKLAQSIVEGDIDAVSMGADVEYTTCSVCGNSAHDILQYCAHIPGMKGRQVNTVDTKTGSTIKKLCYEDCYGVSFFEISFVFDPADESAIISDVMLASQENRSLAHVRKPKETVAAYSERLGTSLTKVASVQMLDVCATCGSSDLAISKASSTCRDCGVVKQADKVLMSLPQEVDTLRDELNCPQCNSEWNGMVCLNCGFELPPEGLGDPDTMPMGLNMPEQGEGDEESGDQGQDSEAPAQKSDDDSKSKSKDKSKKDDSKDKKDSKPKSKSKDDKSADSKKSGSKEEMRVSRFDEELRKQATLPETIPYRQDAYPGTSAEPYGQVTPEGNQPQGVEEALEPAPSGQAVLQDLDSEEVVSPGDTGNPSEVDVVTQPAGPVDTPPPGPAAGQALQGRGASKEKRAEFYRARANALRDRADEFEKKAETVLRTDVRELDGPPEGVDFGPDATADVLKVTNESDQLGLADTPDVINDGSETGAPAVRDRLDQQVNPFNDVALRPYGASVSEDNPAEETEKVAAVEETPEVDVAAERQAREDQRVSAAKTRVLRVANFVDERIEMGLSNPADKFNEIAKFEAMDDATLDGFVQATREFKAKEIRTASKRIAVAAAPSDNTVARMPSLGSVSAPATEEDDPADDYVAFL